MLSSYTGPARAQTPSEATGFGLLELDYDRKPAFEYYRRLLRELG
jgi:hypothetical protein